MRTRFFTIAIFICLLPFFSFSQMSVEDILEKIETHKLVKSNKINCRENDDLLLAESSGYVTRAGYFSDSSTYNYDLDKNITSKHRIFYDYQNSEWVNSQLFNYEYDKFNNKISKIDQLWENDKWLNSYKYEYNANNDFSWFLVEYSG